MMDSDRCLTKQTDKYDYGVVSRDRKAIYDWLTFQF